MTCWLEWLFVTRVWKLVFDRLKARHLVITMFEHAQPLDRCVGLQAHRSTHGFETTLWA